MKERNVRTRRPLPCLASPRPPPRVPHGHTLGSASAGFQSLPALSPFPQSKQEKGREQRHHFINTAQKHSEAGFIKTDLPADNPQGPRWGQKRAPLPVRPRPGPSLDDRRAATQTSGRRKSMLVSPKAGFLGECVLGLLQSARRA